jgi:glycosyltransferase involved in cell wall biosynthesis
MIIIVLTSSYPVKNGLTMGTFVHQQIKALQEVGADCHVLLLHNWFPPLGLHKLHTVWQKGYDERMSHFRELDGVKIHSVPVMHRIPDRIFKNDLDQNAANAIVKYVRNHKELQDAEWIYSEFLLNSGFLATKVKAALDIKISAMALGDDVHAWPEKNPALVEKLKEIFRHTDMLLANSQRLADDTKIWMTNDTRTDVGVVYFGVNSEKFRPAEENEKAILRQKYGLDDRAHYMICIAAAVEAKGWLDLFKAMQSLGNRFDNWKLLMVVSNWGGHTALNLQQIAADMGLQDKVILMGTIDPDGVAELLRASDAFILPSHNEGMANALLEAMSSGLACIATDVGGHAEVVEDGVTGLLIPSKRVEAIAGAIARVIDDEALRLTLCKGARQRMLEFGNYNDNARKLLAKFREHNKIAVKAQVNEGTGTYK